MRKLVTFVGLTVWLLGISPSLWAQGTGPITVTACAPCHGVGAAVPQAAPNFPKLDGQHAAYLEKQLREYMVGKRKSAVMAPIIAALKKQQISEMAKHFASQSPARGTVQNPQLATAGKALYRGGQPRHRCARMCRLSSARWGRLRTLSSSCRAASNLHRAATDGVQERHPQQRPRACHACAGRASHR